MRKYEQKTLSILLSILMLLQVLTGGIVFAEELIDIGGESEEIVSQESIEDEKIDEDDEIVSEEETEVEAEVETELEGDSEVEEETDTPEETETGSNEVEEETEEETTTDEKNSLLIGVKTYGGDFSHVKDRYVGENFNINELQFKTMLFEGDVSLLEDMGNLKSKLIKEEVKTLKELEEELDLDLDIFFKDSKGELLVENEEGSRTYKLKDITEGDTTYQLIIESSKPAKENLIIGTVEESDYNSDEIYYIDFDFENDLYNEDFQVFYSANLNGEIKEEQDLKVINDKVNFDLMENLFVELEDGTKTKEALNIKDIQYITGLGEDVTEVKTVDKNVLLTDEPGTITFTAEYKGQTSISKKTYTIKVEFEEDKPELDIESKELRFLEVFDKSILLEGLDINEDYTLTLNVGDVYTNEYFKDNIEEIKTFGLSKYKKDLQSLNLKESKLPVTYTITDVSGNQTIKTVEHTIVSDDVKLNISYSLGNLVDTLSNKQIEKNVFENPKAFEEILKNRIVLEGKEHRDLDFEIIEKKLTKENIEIGFNTNNLSDLTKVEDDRNNVEYEGLEVEISYYFNNRPYNKKTETIKEINVVEKETILREDIAEEFIKLLEEYMKEINEKAGNKNKPENITTIKELDVIAEERALQLVSSFNHELYPQDAVAENITSVFASTETPKEIANKAITEFKNSALHNTTLQLESAIKNVKIVEVPHLIGGGSQFYVVNLVDLAGDVTETESITEDINFEIIEKETEDLPLGETKVEVEGEKGFIKKQKETIFSALLDDYIEREIVVDEKEPVNKIILKGIGKEDTGTEEGNNNDKDKEILNTDFMFKGELGKIKFTGLDKNKEYRVEIREENNFREDLENIIIEGDLQVEEGIGLFDIDSKEMLGLYTVTVLDENNDVYGLGSFEIKEALTELELNEKEARSDKEIHLDFGDILDEPLDIPSEGGENKPEDKEILNTDYVYKTEEIILSFGNKVKDRDYTITIHEPISNEGKSEAYTFFLEKDEEGNIKDFVLNTEELNHGNDGKIIISDTEGNIYGIFDLDIREITSKEEATDNLERSQYILEMYLGELSDEPLDIGTPGGEDKPGETETPGGEDKPGETETPGGEDKPGETETPGGEDKPGGTDTPGGEDVENNKVKFVKSVYPGEKITVRFKGKPNTKYKITIINPSGSVNKDSDLSPIKKTDSEGFVEWTYNVGTRTKSGKGSVTFTEINSNKTQVFDYIVNEGLQTEDRQDKDLILRLNGSFDSPENQNNNGETNVEDNNDSNNNDSNDINDSNDNNDNNNNTDTPDVNVDITDVDDNNDVDNTEIQVSHQTGDTLLFVLSIIATSSIISVIIFTIAKLKRKK